MMKKNRLRNEMEDLDKDKLKRERKLAKVLSNFFNKLLNFTLKQLNKHFKKYNVNLEYFSIMDYLEEYQSIIEKFNVEEFKNGVLVGERMIKYVTDKEFKIPKFNFLKSDYWAPYVHTLKDLLNVSFIASDRTLRRVDNDIKEVIHDAYLTGNNMNYAGSKIKERYNQLKTWESVRIARTECHNAHNRGVVSAYTNYGAEYTMWMSAHDKRVRSWKKGDKADHVVLDGEIIPIGGTYSNGLHYPGDVSGPLYEFINCRCANAPYVIPPGYMVPPGLTNFHEKDLIKIK